jgi:hypothetical protein
MGLPQRADLAAEPPHRLGDGGGGGLRGAHQGVTFPDRVQPRLPCAGRWGLDPDSQLVARLVRARAIEGVPIATEQKVPKSRRRRFI